MFGMSKEKVINIAVAAAMVIVLAVVFFTMNARCANLAKQLALAEHNAVASQGADMLRIDELTAELTQAKSALEEANAQVLALTEAKAAVDAELVEMTAAKDGLGLEKNEVLAQLTQMEGEKQLAAAQAAELSVALERAEEQVSALEKANTDLNVSAEILSNAKAKLEETVAELTAEKGELEASLAVVTAEKEALQAKLEEISSGKTGDWASEKAALEAQIAALTAENEELKEALAAAQGAEAQNQEVQGDETVQSEEGGFSAEAVVSEFYTVNADMLPAFISLDDQTMIDFYGMDPAWLVDYVCNIPMMNVHATEIFVAQVAQGQMENVKAAIEARKGVLDATWSMYLPDQYELVKNSIVVEKDGYILFAVTEHIESIQAIFEEAIK